MQIDFEKYHFPDVYIPLFNDTNFIILMYGSRNSAKTDFACFLKIWRCLTLPYFKCLMVRRVQSNVNKSIYSKIKSICSRYGIERFFRFSDHTSTIKCYNGNSFLPAGTYETLGSTGTSKSTDDPTDALVDEMDELTETEWRKLIFSIRGSENLQVLGLFNTHIVDESHWIFKMFFLPVDKFEKKDGSHTYVPSKRRNTTILHTTFFMNPFINKIIIEEFLIQKENDFDNYEIEGLGLIKAKELPNRAVKYFKRKDHISDQVVFNKESLIYLAWDFNRLPHHTVSAWQFGGYDEAQNVYNWHMVKEFCLADTSVGDVQKAINTWLKKEGYQHKKIIIICDFSGNTKRDHDAVTDINKIKRQIKKDGFEVSDRTIVNPSVVHSLEFLNDAFGGTVKIHQANPKYGGATLRLSVNPSCTFHIADFEKTKLDREGKILKVVKKDKFLEEGINVTRSYQARGHGVDNARYMITAIFPFEYKLNKSS